MEIDASKLWEKILKIIKKRVNEVEFNTFFKNKYTFYKQSLIFLFTP